MRSQLETLGFHDITITPYAFDQRATSPRDMARKMRHVIMLHTLGWGAERQDKGWKLGERVERCLRDQQGDGEVKIRSVVLLVVAKRP